MKILLEKNPVVAGLSDKIRPDSMQRSGKSGSGRILKMLIRYTPSRNRSWGCSNKAALQILSRILKLKEHFQNIMHSKGRD